MGNLLNVELAVRSTRVVVMIMTALANTIEIERSPCSACFSLMHFFMRSKKSTIYDDQGCLAKTCSDIKKPVSA